VLLVALDECTVSAQGTPDSPGAKATREKKLTTKVKVDFDAKMLREILDELPPKVADAGGGNLRLKIAPGQGVTLTSRFTVKGEKTLAEVLEEICKDRGWGWYVVSTKVGDQNDGAVYITTNPKEHGYKEGTGPVTGKDKEMPKDKKEDPKKEDPKKVDPKPADGEKAATDLLNQGKLRLNLKQVDKAKALFEEIISKYPDTKAAAAAKKELEKLK
jgi:hypothetical protein